MCRNRGKKYQPFVSWKVNLIPMALFPGFTSKVREMRPGHEVGGFAFLNQQRILRNETVSATPGQFHVIERNILISL